ncbi:hypothetical protein [Haloplanus sp.]|uniref:hypothetical protein n=1 Tax=Haloplanus sp. TaxID=1961696 RepID=UPI00260EE48A|nr:hypothetical protein [Haloplanus sp.]
MRPIRLAGQTLLAVATVLFLAAAAGTITGLIGVGESVPVVGAAVCCVAAGGILARS